ncbi:DUF2214 domain-containing protein [Phyllobacterium zundukense]|jgi:hypothetical protein|uniref:DUF2214 domain-containing protein n=1 Tax=Phyllobacterium zundukense TaxID=1867719 RepID=A0ACD4D9B6_9HYPH|nr:DUF2214 domain-containing protein [Phyllobacterium zundukense]UXN62386.1 DUF2214 domain-containing protein [Phyllobacterium zundukense]
MLRRVQVAYLLVNAAHILSIGLVFGAIITLDLRILGLFRRYPIGTLGPPLSRIAAAGIALAIITGLMLFSVRPIAYIHNPAFLIKVGIVGLGITNAFLLNQNRHWRLALKNEEPSRRVQLSALLSVTLWVSAVIAGRWIGFI